MKPGKTGLTRLIHAFGYSVDGLKAGWQREAAIRQEIIALIILLPLGIWLPVGIPVKLALLASTLAVLVVELLNSAVEAVVDLASPDRHDLAKLAKDLGSAAVLMTLIVAIAVWSYAVWLAFGTH
ncbi:diacylglycerol kinase [Leeia sp. TBRC 13508]|uniref:Diacylglycerol kinase n=1 Tax=Leeia speluncae TaxID=2884804 RepID=A0ABS8D8E1_9NEIS|nr:diacylglycerol kinase [Leeia speluncae]MCB6183903.1 diacylglycerol kinase [Leeia speluncae]